MNINMSEKDKKLLYAIVSLLIVAAAWWFGYKPLSAKAAEYEAKYEQLHTRYLDLSEKMKNKSNYIADTEENLETYDEIIATFDSVYTQEYILQYLMKLEDDTEAWMSRITVNNPELKYTFSTDATVEGWGTPITLGLECEYLELKKVIDFINSTSSKCKINTLTFAADAEGILTGNIEMTKYAITSPFRETPSIKIDWPTGTDNIFSSSVFSATSSDGSTTAKGDAIATDYDMFITLNPTIADMDAIVIGLKDNEKSNLSADVNKAETASITISGSNGKYTVAYKLGNTTYPAKNYDVGVNFNPGSSLDLLVMSSARTGDNDKTTLNVSIVNDTDMTLNIKVLDDDTSSPRFNIKSRSGKINVY